MSLSQNTLTAAILGPDLPVPPGLSDGQGGAAGKRFDVYRNNVAVSLTDALIVAFPTIHSLVGDAFFRAMAAVFWRQHPPSSPVMMQYGGPMPGFLAGFGPVAHLPYLPDIARLDLAMRAAYHAEDAPALLPEALDLGPDALMAARFDLAPAVHILASAYPIHGIWQMTRGGAKPGATGQDILISRPGFDPALDLLAPGAAPFLHALGDGKSLAQALEAAPELDPETSLAATLALALQRGVFTRIH
ncbi:MAG: DNA-binding domain-containing protein [Pseudomonadota bacterium]